MQNVCLYVYVYFSYFSLGSVSVLSILFQFVVSGLAYFIIIS